MANIAISLSDDILDAVEKERSEIGISRSEYFRRTVQEHLRREKEKEDVARYIQGYLDDPETPEQMAWTEATIPYAFAGESWEDEYDK